MESSEKQSFQSGLNDDEKQLLACYNKLSITQRIMAIQQLRQLYNAPAEPVFNHPTKATEKQA